MRLALLGILICAPMFISCRLAQKDSKTKSLVGLRADIDENILRGEAPSFQLLQKWFNHELPLDIGKAQAGGVSYRVHNDFKQSSFDALPAEYRKQLIAYLKQQQVRVGDFQANLDNPARLNQLLKLEADEMADILMALIEPGYRPKTADLLARLVAQKSLRSFIDRYSVELLEKLYARSQRSLVLGLDMERDNFAKLLTKSYVTANGATPQFKAALEDNCSKIHDVLAALKSDTSAGCQSTGGAKLAGGKSLAEAAKAIGGTSGRAFGIFAGLTSSDGFAARGAAGPNLTIFSGRNTSANDPYKNGGSPTPPSTPNNTPIPGDGGGGSNVPVVNNDNGSNNNKNNQGDNLLKMLMDLMSEAGMDDESWLSGSPGSSRNRAIEAPQKPRGLCSGKTGLQLVVCQRYIEGLRPLTRDSGAGKRSTHLAEGGNGGTTNNAGYNFYMISEYGTSVQNQGSEGACTAFGLAHVLGILGKIHGKSGEYDAWNIWQAQGQQPMTDAAISAAQGMNFDGLRITSANSIDVSVAGIKRVMDSGRPVYFASDVDSSWDGAERGNADVTCQGSRGVGHAYSLVGYDDSSQKFIIKNSWGDYWGDQGYGYLPYSCIGQMNDDGYDVQVK